MLPPLLLASRGRVLLPLAALTLIAVALSGNDLTARADETPSPSGTVRVVAASNADSSSSAAASRVAAMTLREKAASVVMGHVPGTDPGMLADYMASTGIAGFILMGSNIPPTEGELRALTAALTVNSALPPLIAIDQEGGDVSRLPWDVYPSSVTLKDLPSDQSRDAFAARAALVQRAGIAVNFGIVADVTADPAMFIYRRALGTAPAASAERVAAAVAGEGDRAISTLKHFPGHGAAPGDSHSALPSTAMTKSEWEAGDALPFAAGIDAGAGQLIFGHLVYSAIDTAPATMSAEWHRIAREELGFKGVIITDDLGMLQSSGNPAYADPVANAVAALVAGNDMVLSIALSTSESAPQIVAGITAAVDTGALSTGRLDDAATRVMQSRLDLAAQGRGLVPCGDCTPVD